MRSVVSALLDAVDRVGPRLAVFGHIREGRGRWVRGPTVLANVSLVDERYRPVHRPTAFDLRADERGHP